MEQGTLYQINPTEIGLDGAETELVNKLLREWQRHIGSNIRNESYYSGKVKPVTQDTHMPEELQHLNVVVGWGGKCVDVLAARSSLSTFSSEGTAAHDFLQAVGEADLAELYSQAVTSELIDSCAFITLSSGLKGEPDVIVSARSALDAVALWDERMKRIKCGLSVLDIDEDGNGNRVPTSWVLYTDAYTVKAELIADKWVTNRAENYIGRPLIEPIRYRPTLTRPFGRSRINRTIRSLINRAMCVAVRTETSATFYTWPLRYMLNVDKKTAEAAAQRKIEMYTDTWLFASPNKNGDSPQIGQLSQMTMQPHIEHLEMLAKQFASEASVPLDEVGIVFDNPSSADAMAAAQQRLIVEAEGINRANGIALKNVALMVTAHLNGTDIQSLTDEQRSINAVFADPLRASKAARADYAIKLASVVPEYPSTAHFWRDLGYQEAEIREIQADIRYQQTMAAMAAAAAQAAQVSSTPAPEGAAPEDVEGEEEQTYPEEHKETEAGE